MSVEIPRSILTQAGKEKIVQELTLFPEEDEFVKKKMKVNKTPERFAFFNITSEYVYLPIAYARKTFGLPGNENKIFPIHPYTFTGKLREAQQPVARELKAHLNSQGGCVLAVRTGFGKTILGAEAAAGYGLIVAVLITREILAGQWKKTFEDNTNAKTWIVGETFPDYLPNVIITMDGRVNAIPEQLRRQVGFVIIDEAHMFCTKGRVDALLAFQPRYVLAETATLERDDGLHKMIQMIVGDSIIIRDFDTDFKVFKMITGIQGERAMSGSRLNYGHLLKTTLENPYRNAMIVELVNRYRHHKILVLTSLVEHSKLLCQAIQQRGVSCDVLSGTKKSYQDCNVLVGTIPKIGTGFDPATSCDSYDGRPFDLLILASTIKKYQALTQNVGRVFRSPNPIIFHLVDQDPIFERHWKKCLSWYRSRNGTVAQILLPQELQKQ